MTSFFYSHDYKSAALERAEAALEAHAKVLAAADKAFCDAQAEAGILQATVDTLRWKINYDEEINAAVIKAAAEREAATH